jgi:phenylalanyl-tRNA synthetase beta chain
MRISLNWLKEFVDIDCTPEELADKLTMLGLEIESMVCPGAEVRNVVVGQILSVEPHPDADKVVVCKTDVGEAEPLQIVCGAKNMKPGDKVPTCRVGGGLPGGLEIGRRKMRGVESQGMMCSGRELGLNDDQAGLLILDPDTPVGVDAVPVLGLDDVVYEIEVTPNRNDWSSMIGVARELAAFFSKPLRIPDASVPESGGEAAGDRSSVTIENPDLCARYLGRVFDGVRVGPSPDWMARRLVAAGQRPINNIVDITNYVLLETGHPLHAFDFDKLAENRIVVRSARPGETLVTIDGDTRKLIPENLVIADASSPVAMAGVMGGLDSEVTEGTVRVFLESAWFDPVSVRRTARMHNMATEASQRFQRGADPEMALFALNRAAQLFAEYASASVAPGVIDAYPRPHERRFINLRFDRARKVLGTDVPDASQRQYLEALGFSVQGEQEGGCRFQVPTWRHDCSIEEDLIEEIVRLHGYDRVPSSVAKVRIQEKEYYPEDRALRCLRPFLTGLGLVEVINMSFSSVAETRRSGFEEPWLDMVALQNPMSENQSTMRTSLIPGLLGNVAHNLRHGSRNIRLFEIGPVYRPNPNADLPDQSLHLAVALSGMPDHKHWSRPETAFDFYDLKGVVDALGDFFGLPWAIEAAEFGPMEPGQTGALVLDTNRTIGRFGEVRRAVCKAYDLEQPVWLLELDLAVPLKQNKPKPRFEPLPAYPPVLRDLAVVVPSDLQVGDLVRAACQSGGKYLRDVALFDIYTGKQVPEGKKSVALSLVFQSPEMTLTEKVTQKAMDGILRKLQTEFGAELR